MTEAAASSAAPSAEQPAVSDARLTRVVLAGEALTRLSPLLEADRAQAVADLTAVNQFRPLTVRPGQEACRHFALHLSIQEGRLVFDIRCGDAAGDGRDGESPGEAPVAAILLALGPFRGLIKDYQLLVDSHIKAVEEGRAERIQAIDMGRRGLHNEGANLLIQRLAGKIEIDFETARRLFTLVCVLHQRI